LHEASHAIATNAIKVYTLFPVDRFITSVTFVPWYLCVFVLPCFRTCGPAF
jgi:hypothetical protein